MYKVICILGKSGVGKDTLAKELCSNKKYHFVKSYTTREIRKNDPEDINHHTFVKKSFREEFNERDILVEYRNEKLGYCSWTSSDLFDEDKINVYVVDIDAYIKLSKKHDFNCIGIYLKLSELEREKRYKERNKDKTVPKDLHLGLEYALVKSVEDNKLFVCDINKKTPKEISKEVNKLVKTYLK